MKGYTGFVLRVDLSRKSITKEPLKEALARNYAGGRGINSRILYDEVRPGTDPLGPANKIIVGTGPCNGTIVPGSQRFTVTAKSPLTGFHGDSNSGGAFGAELKYAGYDHIIIEGQSSTPAYLYINDDTVELKPARHLRGKTTIETTRTIRRETGDMDVCTISIGPGGENLVRFACLMSDLGRGLGRSGMGAVFGSKNLKAIAVRGSQGVKVAHPRLLEKAARQTYEDWKKNPSFTQSRFKYGTPAGWTRYQKFGMLATRNSQSGISEKSMLEGLDNYLVGRRACFSCPAACDHAWVIPDGPYKGTFGQGAELYRLGDWGPKIGCDDLSLIFKASETCNEYGLDGIDTSGVIAFAMECFQRGILTERDTGGLKLEWGSADAILGLIGMIARKEGIGAILGQGLKRAAKAIGKGSEKYAMHVKGQALIMRDPRGFKSWGLAYAVSSRGACHVRAHFPADDWDADVQDILKKYRDATNHLSEEGKGELLKWNEDLAAFRNSLEICLFSNYSWMSSIPPTLAGYYNAVTGFNIDGDEVLRIGERITNVERAFNIREGLTRKDDTLPERMLREPMPDGPAKGQVVKLDIMLDDYYKYRGWNRVSGLPTRKKLLELGLGDVAEELGSMGKLAANSD